MHEAFFANFPQVARLNSNIVILAPTQSYPFGGILKPMQPLSTL
jgi:hypothetical protein